MFEIYLKRNDIDCLKLLLIRGSNINYINKNTLLTPLHLAIEHRASKKIVNFMLRHNANPHIEDREGRDCCDKAK